MNGVKLTELLKITKFSKSCCYRQIKNSTAPRAIKLGGRVVAWLLDVVNAWLEKIGKQSHQENTEMKKVSMQLGGSTDLFLNLFN